MRHFKTSPGLSLCKALGLAAVQWMTAAALYATPYATCITNSAGVFSFRLNEAADSVKIISGAVTNDLGALGKGLTTITNLGITNDFKIEVTKTNTAGWMQGTALQLSSDSNPALQFEQPVGVAVNTNPASPYFGRVYVSNSRSVPTATGRTATEGIYVFTPDLTDAFGQGDTGLTAGITTFDSATYDATSPWRIAVGEDDNLYISDFNPNTGTIWVTDPSVSEGSGKYLFDDGPMGPQGSFGIYHGQIPSSPVVTGSLAQTNLTVYTLDADYFDINGLHEFDMGGGPLPWAATFTNLTGPSGPLSKTPAGGIVGMDRAADGKFYLTQYSEAGDLAGLIVLSNQETNDDGSLKVIYSSLDDWRAITGNPTTNDFMRHAYAVKVSPVGNYLAVPTADGPTFIVPLNTNGLPILTNRMTVNTASSGPTGDVCFDRAGNLYVVNSALQVLRVFSAGGRSVATTGSDGTFAVEHAPGALPPPPIYTEITVVGIQVNGSTIAIDFTTTSTGPFSVLSSPTVAGEYTADGSATVVSTGANSYRATATMSGGLRFYRIVAQGTPPPPTEGISIVSMQVNGTAVLIDFTTTLAGPFKVASSGTVTGQYATDGSATVTSTGSNTYRATTTTSGAMRFYRVGK